MFLHDGGLAEPCQTGLSRGEQGGAAPTSGPTAGMLPTTSIGSAAEQGEDELMESANTWGLLIVLVLLYLATLRWGVDSTDGPDSREWERRRGWRGLGGLHGRSG